MIDLLCGRLCLLHRGEGGLGPSFALPFASVSRPSIVYQHSPDCKCDFTRFAAIVLPARRSGAAVGSGFGGPPQAAAGMQPAAQISASAEYRMYPSQRRKIENYADCIWFLGSRCVIIETACGAVRMRPPIPASPPGGARPAVRALRRYPL